MMSNSPDLNTDTGNRPSNSERSLHGFSIYGSPVAKRTRSRHVEEKLTRTSRASVEKTRDAEIKLEALSEMLSTVMSKITRGRSDLQHLVIAVSRPGTESCSMTVN